MKCAIMQPTYLPWMGYFDLMDQSDVFVFLDSVQFEKRSWQQRNKIKTQQGEEFLTVPVLSKGRYNQKILQTQIDQTAHFYKTHIKAINCNYAKTQYFKQFMPELETILIKAHAYLVDLNIELISWLKQILGIKTEFIRSSELSVKGKKAELLINICKKVGGESYLAVAGSRAYIEKGQDFTKADIRLQWHNFVPPVYSQLYGAFIPYLSVIDLLFNEGEKSLSIIRSGRQA